MIGTHALLSWSRLLALAGAALLAGIAYAQPSSPEPDDPPVRVGRISYVSGDVSFSPAGNQEWVHARVNRPIVTGDCRFFGSNSRGTPRFWNLHRRDCLISVLAHL